jgi:hypothetical protein
MPLVSAVVGSALWQPVARTATASSMLEMVVVFMMGLLLLSKSKVRTRMLHPPRLCTIANCAKP